MNNLTKHIKLDFRSEVPLYIQIMEQVEQMIASQELKVGDQLPTVRELATDLKINWNTVARAYRSLDEASLISTQRGRGTYVWEKPTEEAIRKIHQESLEAMTRRFLSDAARHGCTPQEVSSTFQSFLQKWEAGETPQEE
ncbi:MAG TPA: GntR family transcriptional regulator [Anaerolineaceae bacterium]